MNEYLRALEDRRVPPAIAERVQSLIGLPVGVFADDRVEQSIYREAIVDRGLLAATDPRLHFPDTDPRSVKRDAGLDAWEPHYQRLFQGEMARLGIPPQFAQDLGDVIVVPEWRFEAPFENRRSTEAMIALLRKHELAVLNITGRLDPLATTAKTDAFWNDVAAQTNQRVENVVREDLAITTYRPGTTYTTMLNCGHQLTADIEARGDLHDAVKKFVNDLSGR